MGERGMRSLFAASGCSVREAQHNVADLDIPRRVVRECGKLPDFVRANARPRCCVYVRAGMMCAGAAHRHNAVIASGRVRRG